MSLQGEVFEKHPPILPASRAQYWRWGLPSLVLAIMTLLITCISYGVTQPRILPTYEQYLEQSKDRLTKTIAAIDESSDPGVLRDALDQQYKSAVIVAKRLISEKPDDAWPRWTLAQFELGIRENALGNAQLAVAQGNLNEVSTWSEKARSARDRAFAALRDAATRQGNEAQRARLWLGNDQLETTYLFANPDSMPLAEIEMNLSPRHYDSELDDDLQRLQAKIMIQRSLDVLKPMDRKAIYDNLLNAWTTLAQGDSARMRTELILSDAASLRGSDWGWALEVLACLDAKAAESEARWYLLERAPKWNPQRADRIQVLERGFRAFLAIRSLDEAIGFAAARLGSLPSDEQTRFRFLMAECLLRRISFLAVETENASPESLLYLQYAWQIAPNAPRVERLVQWMTKDISTNPVVQFLKDQERSQPTVAPIVHALAFLRETRGISQPNNEEHAVSIGDAGLLTAVTSALMSFAKEPVDDRVRIGAGLDTLIASHPNVVDLRIARGLLALQQEDLETAEASFVQAAALAPGIDRIGELLNEVREKKMRSPSASRTEGSPTP